MPRKFCWRYLRRRTSTDSIPMNVGYLSTQRPGLVPCTPAGIMEILKRSGIQIAGAEAVVVGRSDIVGKPVAMLLLNGNATVTVCHSKTRDLPGVCRRADILVAAIGKRRDDHARLRQAGCDRHRRGHQRGYRSCRVQGILRRKRQARTRFRSEGINPDRRCSSRSRGGCGRDDSCTWRSRARSPLPC